MITIHIKKMTKLLLIVSVFLCVSVSAQQSCIGVNDKPGVVGTWAGAGRYDGEPTEKIVIKYVPAKSLSYTSCKTVTVRAGFPSFGIYQYQVCTPVTECIHPYYEATVTHFTHSKNEVISTKAQGKLNGDWLYFDIQRDDLLRFWVRPQSNTSSNKNIDYVLWTMSSGGYSEEWIKVTKIK